MPRKKIKPRTPPAPIVIPAELEELALQLYPNAVDRYSVLSAIHGFIDRLQEQGRYAEIPAYLLGNAGHAK